MSTTTRLLIIAQGIDGGTANLASQLAEGMSCADIVCSVIYVGRPSANSFTEHNRAQNIQSLAVPTGPARTIREAIGLLTSISHVLRAARQFKPTTILFAGFIPALVYPLFLRPITTASFIFWDHAPQNTFLTIKKTLFPLSLHLFKYIVSISTSTKDALVSYFGVAPEKIIIIPNGIDPTKWIVVPPAPDFSCLKVIMPARMDLNQKDHLTLIKAVKILRDKNIPIQVTFVGSGIDEQAVAEAVSETGMNEWISLFPHSEDMPSLLATHNAVCLSTKFEGLPTVLIEGMLAQRVVVAARTQGCVDVIEDGETGFLFTPNDENDCANTLLDLLKRTDLSQIIATASHEASERFSPQAMFDQFRKILQ